MEAIVAQYLGRFNRRDGEEWNVEKDDGTVRSGVILELLREPCVLGFVERIERRGVERNEEDVV